MSRRRPSRLRTPLLLAMPLVLGGVYFLFAGIEEPIQQAVEKQHVTVQVTAKDETKATIEVTRGGGAPSFKSLTIIVPAGTVIRNNDPGGQWLMTAQQGTILLAANKPTAELTVETYCLHQLDKPPTLSSSLDLAPAGSDGRSSEYEATQRLAQCLEGMKVRYARQLAIWMTSDGLIDRDYRDAEYRLRQGVALQAARKSLDDMKSDLFQRARPDPRLEGTSDEDLKQAVDAYVEAHPDRYDPEVIERSVREQMAQILAEAKPLLGRCLPDASSKSFFASAP